MSERQPSNANQALSTEQREFLKALAERAIGAAVRGEPAPDPRTEAQNHGIELAGPMLENRGAFVTLTRAGNLRGCIGYIQGFKPLVEAVVDNARSAAVNDPRFQPVSEEELAGLDWEISALTPLRAVSGFEEIRVGVHGILLTKNGRQSVFLPQVATEQGWDLETTLTHLAMKAGLPADGWRTGAEFEVFEAEIF